MYSYTNCTRLLVSKYKSVTYRIIKHVNIGIGAVNFLDQCSNGINCYVVVNSDHTFALANKKCS